MSGGDDNPEDATAVQNTSPMTDSSSPVAQKSLRGLKLNFLE